jgi:hypothetical protein
LQLSSFNQGRWYSLCLAGRRYGPETHTNTGDLARLPAHLAGHGDKGIEIVHSEEKNILYLAYYRSSQGRTKISCTGTTSPTNQPRKGSIHLSSLSPHHTSVSTVSRGHPFIVSLVRMVRTVHHSTGHTAGQLSVI